MLTGSGGDFKPEAGWRGGGGEGEGEGEEERDELFDDDEVDMLE